MLAHQALAGRSLGRGGHVVTWVTYVLIYLPTITAYIAEGGNLVAHFAHRLAPALVTGPAIFQLGFAALFGTVVLRGPAAVDLVNRGAITLAMLAFAALVLAAAAGVSPDRLGRAEWAAVPRSVPVILVAMAFHNTVPTVAAYLGSARATALAVAVGVAVPVAMYLVWEALIIGSLDPAGFGPGGLSTTAILDQLREQAGQVVSVAVELFELLAIVTSVLGVGLGTVDFLHEGLFGGAAAPAGAQTATGAQTQRRLAVLAAFGPTLAVALVAPGIFLPALELSVSARLVLFGVVPVLLVWKLRYGADKVAAAATVPPGTVPGGRAVLVAVGGLSIGLIVFDLHAKIHRAFGADVAVANAGAAGAGSTPVNGTEGAEGHS